MYVFRVTPHAEAFVEPHHGRGNGRVVTSVGLESWPLLLQAHQKAKLKKTDADTPKKLVRKKRKRKGKRSAKKLDSESERESSG